MKISIVTVTYNCESVIEETLKSVIGQDYNEKDIVVIDGASTDNTCSIIEKYKSRTNTFISEKDKGIFDAMNKSLDYVKGDYVVFINAGDKFVNKHVISDVFANYNGNDDLIYGDVYVQTEFGYKLNKADAIYTHNPSKHDLVFKSQGFCHQSLFTKVSVLRTVQFDINYPLGADYLATYSVFLKGNGSIKYVGFPISVFDDRSGGASHKPEVLLKLFSERFKMFNYESTLFERLCLYKEYYKNFIKLYLEKLLPFIVKPYRRAKYITNLPE